MDTFSLTTNPPMAILDIVGDTYTEEILFDEERVAHFINFSKDSASIHTKKDFSDRKGFDELVVHGFLLSTNFSRILGMYLPGENTVIGNIELQFHKPVYVGEKVRYTVTVTRTIKALGSILLDLLIEKNEGVVCVKGKASCFFKKDLA